MAATARLSRRLCAAAVAGVSGGAVLLYQPSLSANDLGGGSQLSAIRQRISDLNAAVPSRAVQEAALIGSSSVNPLDVLVIGGGATGSGVALDAVTRGLRVGLVERDDFSSGTSSRSTKLIHGGM
jgi:glycerol-3-phosphate dehydrogenase